MLHFIREHARGWVAWFIVGLISIPFALWGVNSYFDGPVDVVIAKVNGETITQAQFQREYQLYRDRLREVMGDEFDPVLVDSAEVRRRLLDNLIEKKIIVAATNELGQYIPDVDINDLIQSTDDFQRDGQFELDYYRAILAGAGLTPTAYESQLRHNLLVQQLRDNIKQTALVTAKTLNNIIRLERQTRDIAYGIIPVQPYIDMIVVSEMDARQYFTQHKDNYMAPEQISVDYIELSAEELAQAVEVDDTLLQQFYQDNQDQFVAPQQRKVSHILIEGEQDNALTQLAEIAYRLEAGDSFSALASQFSADVGSANNGGDLGWLQRGDTDAEFEQAVFALTDIGAVSDPVKTEFGYHLIKLTGIKELDARSYRDVRAEVAALYRRQQAEDIFYEQADILADLSYENPGSLNLVATELGVKIKTSEAFTRKGSADGIAQHHRVVTAAFSDDVLNNDLNSEVINLNELHLLVLRKNKYTPSQQLSYASIAPTIKAKLQFERARDKAREQGEMMLARLASGEGIDAVFTEDNWTTLQTYSRASNNVDKQLLQYAFSAKKPVGDGSVFSGFIAQNGDYIIVELAAVNEGDPNQITAEYRDNLKSYLMQYYGEGEWRALVATLKADADIDIVTKNLM